MFKNAGFVRAGTIAVACLGAAILGAFLLAGLSDYRSARAISLGPDTHEAIDGLYIGAAVQFQMIYEVVAAGLLVHLLPLLTVRFRRRGLLVAISLALIAFAIVAVFLAWATRAPVVTAAAATSTVLAVLSILAATRAGRPDATLVRPDPPAARQQE
jgi:hypothetical protein